MEEKKRYCAYCGHEIKDGERHDVRIDDYGNTVYTCRRCFRRSILIVMSAAAVVTLLSCLLAAVIS